MSTEKRSDVRTPTARSWAPGCSDGGGIKKMDTTEKQEKMEKKKPATMVTLSDHQRHGSSMGAQNALLQRHG